MSNEKDLGTSTQSQKIDLDTILNETFEIWFHDFLTYTHLIEARDLVEESPICNLCDYFMLDNDPDPWDEFRCNDKKALCLKQKAVIVGALEYPSEWQSIFKPLWCPKLGRKLSKDEKEKSIESLTYAQKRFEGKCK